MIEFTELELSDVIYNVITPQYYGNSTVQKLYQLDDIIQDCFLWYYKPMKSGEQRLEFLKRTCKSKAHLINTVKQGLYQYIPCYSRYSEFKNVPTSLNIQISDDSDDEFLELIESHEDPVELQVIMSQMLEQLSEKQRRVLQDILNGQTKTSMRQKYSDFDYILEDIRDDIYLYYINSEEDVNIDYQLSLKGFKKIMRPILKDRVKDLYNKFIQTGNPLFYVQSKELERVTE